MAASYSLGELAAQVQAWCEEHRVLPANGQAAEAVTERTIRYYRTLGLLDAPEGDYVRTFTEKHRLQLLAIRIYQARGVPLRRIRELLYGQNEETLRSFVQAGGRRRKSVWPEGKDAESFADPGPGPECWHVIPLPEDFLLISRRDRPLRAEFLARLQAVIAAEFAATTGGGR